MTISARPHRVAVLCYEHAELLDVTGPANVLSVATRLLPEGQGYEVDLLAERKGPVTTAGGLQLVAPWALKGYRRRIDTLLVPGGLRVPRRLAAHVKRLAARAGRVVSVCSGALLLAEAGVLRDRRAATHWAAADALRERDPSIDVEEDAIYVVDDGVWTSAGVTAGMDLSLALVTADHGAELAMMVARWLVMYMHRAGGQSQFSAPLAAMASAGGPLGEVLRWAPEHLDEDLSVSALAARAGMSERNFARVFADEVGETPAAWVQRVRVEAARRELEWSRLSVKEIAARCGYRAPETFHRAFVSTLGVTPLEYRQRFQPTAPPARGSR
jgi:transcriptional regulator GlxA family with amidase domain